VHAGSHLAAGFDERFLRKGVVGNAVWGLPFRQGQKQIPFGNDRKKGKRQVRVPMPGSLHCSLRPPVEMMEFGQGGKEDGVGVVRGFGVAGSARKIEGICLLT
jgi:hypothetical protein